MARRTKAQNKAEVELLRKVRDRYKVMYEADEDNRRRAMRDMKFVNVPGEQWEQNMKLERGDRPCFEFNKLRVNGKRVINEIRANRPQGKTRGVEGGDKETAEIYDGLIRNIDNISDFATIQDYAAEYQVNGGMACWRVITEYRSDSVFDQDILIEPIKNPFCLFVDPSCQDILKRDAYDWILTDRLSRREFDIQYPDAQPADFDVEDEFDNQDEWEDEEFVRRAEYWWKEPITKVIVLLQDGAVIEKDSDEYAAIIATQPEMIVKERIIKSHTIMMAIVSGDAVLEQPVEQAGSQHRFIMVFGEHIVIDGKPYWWGLPRFAKDAQRSYNISRTAITETIAQAPQAKFWATADQAQGNTNKWAEAHQKNFPFLLYNADPKAPGPPVRMGGADVPIALIQESQLASQEIRDVTGLHEASFGEESNETSGIALARKQRQGALVTFNYPDNMAKGVKRTYEIIIDLIPHVYDTDRELRILGSDGAEDYIRVNSFVQDPQTGEAVKINDLAQGKYDVTVTTGPSFSTLREEAATVYSDIGQKYPELMAVAGDLIFKSLDLPFAEDIAERLQLMLPPQIQQQISQGKEIPPEAQQAMAQAEQAMQQVQEQGQLVQAAADELEEQRELSEKAKADVELQIEKLRTQEAKFEAKIARELSKLAQEEMEASGGEAESVVQAIQQMSDEFKQQAIQTLAEIQARTEPTVVVPPAPRIREIRAGRIDGELVATPVYE